MVACDGRLAQVGGPGAGPRQSAMESTALDRAGGPRLPLGIMTTRQSFYAYAYDYPTRTAGRGRRRLR